MNSTGADFSYLAIASFYNRPDAFNLGAQLDFAEGFPIHCNRQPVQDEPAQVAVYYYDHDLATSEGIDETGLLESLEESSDHADIEHIEYSSVKEVIDWLQACI